MTIKMKESIAHYSKIQLNHIKCLHEQIEAREHKNHSLAFRAKVLEKQRMKNYQSEYDRIRAHLSDSKSPGMTTDMAKNRSAELKALGAKHLSGIA